MICQCNTVKRKELCLLPWWQPWLQSQSKHQKHCREPRTPLIVKANNNDHNLKILTSKEVKEIQTDRCTVEGDLVLLIMRFWSLTRHHWPINILDRTSILTVFNTKVNTLTIRLNRVLSAKTTWYQVWCITKLPLMMLVQISSRRDSAWMGDCLSRNHLIIPNYRSKSTRHRKKVLIM